MAGIFLFHGKRKGKMVKRLLKHLHLHGREMMERVKFS
jgi:hypothetical protein